MWQNSAYSLDLTDESFYLAWISNPFAYDVSVTNFGFVYHYLYFLLNDDVASLRMTNVIITVMLSWWMTYVFLRSLAGRESTGGWRIHTLAAGLSVASLTIYDSWLLTPNYNSLTFQALMIVTVGFLLADNTTSRGSVVGWLLMAIGGWLVFMAKPSSALVLAIVVPACLLIARKFSSAMFLLAATSTSGLLVATALLIDGSLGTFAARLCSGLELALLLDAGHVPGKILLMDHIELTGRIGASQFMLAALASFVVGLGCLVLGRRLIAVMVLLTAVLLGGAAFHALSVAYQELWYARAQWMMGLAAVFFLVAVGHAATCRDGYRRLLAIRWGEILLLVLMPLIYASGTNGSYWVSGSSVVSFWLLAGLGLLHPLAQPGGRWAFALPLVIYAQVATAALLQVGMSRPYRQPGPLVSNDVAVEFGGPGSRLVLPGSYAKYIDEARTVARRAGLVQGTPIIDLSGQSPGIIYALGAEGVGQPWLIGGYPGSKDYAQAALEHVSCARLAAAWVLLEPQGARSIDSGVMGTQGADFPGKYRLVGHWKTAEGSRDGTAGDAQLLYAPISPETTFYSCQALRRAGEIVHCCTSDRNL